MVLGGEFGVTGYGVEAPCFLPSLGIIGRDIPTHTELGATVADQHLALDDAWRAGDRVALAAIKDGIDTPHRLAGGGVQGDQPTVEAADVDLAIPHRHAPIDRAAAALTEVLRRHLRVVFPQHGASGGIQGVDHAEGAGGVHHAVDHDRRGLDTEIQFQLGGPGQAELADVAGVDLIQRAIALFVVGATMAHPVAWLAISMDQALRINSSGRSSNHLTTGVEQW